MNELSTGEVARACAVSPDTIRYYEKRGAIAADRSGNGGRRFPESAIARVRVLDRKIRERMRTKDPRALDAIHDFIRFQIREHKM